MMNLLKHNSDSNEPSMVIQHDVLDPREVTFDLWKKCCVENIRSTFNGEAYFKTLKLNCECQLFRSLIGESEPGNVNNCPIETNIQDTNGNTVPNPYLVDVGHLIPQYSGMFYVFYSKIIIYLIYYMLMQMCELLFLPKMIIYLIWCV